jgi:hypothetical protein
MGIKITTQFSAARSHKSMFKPKADVERCDYKLTFGILQSCHPSFLFTFDLAGSIPKGCPLKLLAAFKLRASFILFL